MEFDDDLDMDENGLDAEEASELSDDLDMIDDLDAEEVSELSDDLDMIDDLDAEEVPELSDDVDMIDNLDTEAENELGDELDVLDAEDEVAEELSDFDLWKQQVTELDPDLDERTLEALYKDTDQRSYRESELVDLALHPDFVGQRSILVDRETGKAVKDENGEFVTCARNHKGSKTPDGIKQDVMGVHIREVKNYSSLNNLKQNIRKQAEDRWDVFGRDIDLLFVVAPNRFTVADANELQRFVEEELGARLEWQRK